jgi:protein arginine N-methyltransferase 2
MKDTAVDTSKTQQEEEDEDLVDVEKAKAVVTELFLSGAIWNDLDTNDETPGCLAYRLGWMELYELCVQAGVRAELLLGLLGSYEELESDEEEEEEEVGDDAAEGQEANAPEANGKSEQSHANEDKETVKRDVNSEDYLASTLHVTNDNLLDADNNGVMMTWETDIMRRTVDLFLSTQPPQNDRGLKILNIGFGLGIIDTMFKELNPRPQKHHIIEAHPDVLATVATPTHPFGPSWTASSPSPNDYEILPGKWQAVVPQLVEQGQKYDAIYFDTFGEDYSQLKLFIQDYVPELLEEGGRFGFFNGLGADRRVCYDVYTRVVEMDLSEVGMAVEWEDVDVGEEVTGVKEGEGEWKGVRRRYWVLDKYRLPICKLDV